MNALQLPRAPGLPAAPTAPRPPARAARPRCLKALAPHAARPAGVRLACALGVAAAAALAPGMSPLAQATPAPPARCASVSALPADSAVQAPASDMQWWLASIALMVGIALRRTSP